MMKKRSIYLGIFIVMVFAAALYAAQPAKEGSTSKPTENLTNKEMAVHIKEKIEVFDEILNVIPGLKKQTDKEGNISYTYNGSNLEEMDRKDLVMLLRRVRNEAVKINTERINKQLESIRQTQQANMAVEQASRAGRIAAQRNQPTNPPPSVPQLPKSVQPPPQPPRTR